MIQVKATGSLDKMAARIKALAEMKFLDSLDAYGAEGVAALSAATPVATGASANSWTYELRRSSGYVELVFINTNMAGVTSTPVVILIQYGHGTGTGGYVAGRDFINPVIKPLFERIKADMRKAVSST